MFLGVGTILAHALVGWALCAATIGIGMAVTTVNNALIIHAIGAPIYFSAVSYYYFRKFGYTKPLPTALVFIAVVIGMDFFLVALVINRSLAMFGSLLGTWIPFALIFLSTYLTGLIVQRGKRD
jgi:multisubunit Na+/H+ antiporter MnhC subunit